MLLCESKEESTVKRFEKKQDHIIDNFPDYNDYNAPILLFFNSECPNRKIEGYNYFSEFENRINYVDIDSIPIISISEIESMRKQYELSEEANNKIKTASSLIDLGYPFSDIGKSDDLVLQILKDRLTDGFMLSYPHGVVLSQRRGNYLYRGESDAYGCSKASAYRKNIIPYPYSLFVSNLKIETLKILLNEMDFIKNWKYGDILYEAIAQHYGLKTSIIDVTSHIDTALFFAFCYYDYKMKKYFPYSKIEQKYSILYYTSTGYIEFLNNKYVNKSANIEIQPIGFQPFMRCSRQHGYALYTNIKDDLYRNPFFKKFRILHNNDFVEFSNYIYNIMEGGEKLFPADEGYYMQLLINKIDRLVEFSPIAFREAYRKWDLPISKTQLSKKLNDYGIKIRNHIDYAVDSLLKEIEKTWIKYNFINTGEVIPKNRPAIKAIEGIDWGGFYIQTGWGKQTREESINKFLNEEKTNV